MDKGKTFERGKAERVKVQVPMSWLLFWGRNFQKGCNILRNLKILGFYVRGGFTALKEVPHWVMALHSMLRGSGGAASFKWS